MSNAEILINRIKYLYMLNQIFHDEIINENIIELNKKGKIKLINTLEECQNEIKPSTVYIGLIKQINKL
jgi:hypothetical protein